jgi:hypothetical protein
VRQITCQLHTRTVINVPFLWYRTLSTASISLTIIPCLIAFNNLPSISDNNQSAIHPSIPYNQPAQSTKIIHQPMKLDNPSDNRKIDGQPINRQPILHQSTLQSVDTLNQSLLWLRPSAQPALAWPSTNSLASSVHEPSTWYASIGTTALAVH